MAVSDYVVSTVCLRRYPLGEALEVAAALGFDAIDLVGLRGLCEHVPVMGSTKDLMDAAAIVRSSDLRPASVNADPGSFDGHDDQRAVLGRVERLLDFAADVAAPILVLPAGEKRTEPDVAPAVGLMAEWMNRSGELARSRGIRLAIEAPYFGRPIDRISRTTDLLAELEPSIELAFDVSHVAGAGESVPDALRLFRDQVAVVHVRDAVAGDIRRVLGAGEIDFAGFLGDLSADGWMGDVVLELETRNSPFVSKEAEVLAAVALLDAARTRSFIAPEH
ncbi:hypothetical protein CVS47_02821 [Microbacterium lemovicicum]|uniref:Xylose isomerase-like TIM barrel domain-containing protein n=2 Tax=Microbacterium lemovicicum TaxID=1072463 RepID=A0A3Q9J053_9MICO|nr:hypothetical protein CVS47_02821 [Microbacterium lemovicicum]